MRRGRWAVLFLALTTAAGCGDSNSAVVHGTVTVDGKPVEDGAINFVPVEGDGWTAGAPLQKNGRYSVRVPLGALKVEITASKVIGSKPIYDTPDSPVMPIKEQTLPPRYNEQTELRVDVQGDATQDFDLKSE